MLPATPATRAATRKPWGRLPGMVAPAQELWTAAARAWPAGPLLAFGRGRSYGDCCMAAGTALDTRRLDNLLAFDRERGIVTCEAGVTLAALLDVIVPAGWTLPVMPGTQFVSVGGAIANDVHGKNHERAGSFGRHVLAFDLVRSDGPPLRCTATDNAALFAATIGGLGLTGLIAAATLQLAPLPSAHVLADAIPFDSVAMFAELCERAVATHEFTVGWFDAYSWRDGRFRGVLQRASYADDGAPPAAADAHAAQPRSVPLALAAPALMPWTIRRFNDLYYRVQVRKGTHRAPFRRDLFPLDAIAHWNAVYGSNGFYQLQCVFPAAASGGVDALLARIAAAREGSFLAVLKRFGALPSPGVLSFPTPGLTLALDFQNRGESTRRLLADAAALVADHGGRIYPAKDATMPAAVFRAAFPQWGVVESARDPRFRSQFWDRVTA
jgi:FAD/FMN-containing dehydrogenase